MLISQLKRKSEEGETTIDQLQKQCTKLQYLLDLKDDDLPHIDKGKKCLVVLI